MRRSRSISGFNAPIILPFYASLPRRPLSEQDDAHNRLDMNVDLPKRGIITLLFTDLVGSTKDWEEDPERMDQVLRIHDEVSGRILSDYGGYISKRTGDGLTAVFASPVQA